MYLTQLLHRQAQQRPDSVMTISAGVERTVREVADRVARFAGALQSLGVVEGDRVGMLALNSDIYHEYLLAVPWAGAVVAPVNTRWSAKEMIYSLQDAQIKVLLVDDAFAAMVPELRQGYPELSAIIYCGEAEPPPGTPRYQDLLQQHEPVPDARRGDEQVFGIFYTGGTTGEPKGVMLSHNNILVSAMGSLASTEAVSEAGTSMVVAPMFHMAAIAHWTMSLLKNSTLLLVPAFEPAKVVKLIDEHQVTDALLVPTMLQHLVAAAVAAQSKLSSFTRLLYGASPMPPVLLERIRDTFPGLKLTQAFGMTELSPVATLLADQDHAKAEVKNSCGRAPVNCEIRVVDWQGQDAAPGEIGEVICRGSNVMLGYWNKPEVTADAIRDGWMHTGDLGYLTQDGYLFVVDRLKDMIISGGENIYSVEVENALSQHPAVAMVAVIGLPDQQWGERVHAAVVLRAGATVSAEELIASCRKLIAGYKIPRSIDFLAELPISGAGKILKREIRAGHQSGRDGEN
ncbi:fatty-acid--CoA ligase [Psychromicrobium lacuslunae]|uniref:Fatty-acid--CoA ligase n=1 Tax=Psychromicrobium lacuslunae TaxID=1618207 RepID=A0A0D4C2Z0_9MICC|nr:fatty-acid--CoA ligase [Psychromicrobium lacuslunae]